MTPELQRLIKNHESLKRTLGADHPDTIAAKKLELRFQEECPHKSTRVFTATQNWKSPSGKHNWRKGERIRMCVRCHLPLGKV